jgi:hypothetical protein
MLGSESLDESLSLRKQFRASSAFTRSIERGGGVSKRFGNKFGFNL